MSNPQKTLHGKSVATVKISGKEYVTVAERSRFAHETFGTGDMFGYEIIERQFITLGDRYFISVTIRIQDHTYCGTSEIRLSNAPKGSADEKAPMECAETSAIGRALGFAGIGVLDTIASADEMRRTSDQANRPAAQPVPLATNEPIVAGKVRWLLNKHGYTTVATQDAFLTSHQFPITGTYTPAVFAQIDAALQAEGGAK